MDLDRELQLGAWLEKHQIPLSIHDLDHSTTHDSYLNIDPEKPSNERLEVVGDAVIDLLAVEWLYLQLPKSNESLITQLRSEIVENAVIGKLAHDLGLMDITLRGKGCVLNEKQLADSLEAIFGMLFLRVGIDKTREIFLRLFGRILEGLQQRGFKPFLWDKNQNNPKNKLQEMFQKRGFPLPKLDLIEESGPPHKRKFVSRYTCKIGKNTIFATGTGATKKESEKNAAANLLQRIKSALNME